MNILFFLIGVVAGVGRIAMTNAMRQVGRQFGREVVQRIFGGEAIENVLTREEMRLLAKRIGRVAFDELMRQGREELMNDTDKKQRDLDEKINNFARNLNEQFRQNTRLYCLFIYLFVYLFIFFFGLALLTRNQPIF